MVQSATFTLADTIYTIVLYTLFAGYIAKALDKLESSFVEKVVVLKERITNFF